MSRLLDHVFLNRPILWIPGWVFVFAGFFWGAGLPLFGVSLPTNPRFWHTLASYTLLMSAVLIWNQIADVESDRINQKVLILPRGLVSIRAAWAQSALLLLVSLALGVPLGGNYLLLWFLSLAMGALYTLRPFLLKGRPGAHILMNGVGYGLVAFLVGWSAAGPLTWEAAERALPYVLSVIGVTVYTTIPDIPGDRAAGEITLACLIGGLWAARLGALVVGLSLLAAIWVRDPFVASVAAVSLPFFAWASLGGQDKPVKVAYRLGSGLLVLFLGLRMPGLLLCALAVGLGVKLYYRHRFGITDYPSLGGR